MQVALVAPVEGEARRVRCVGVASNVAIDAML
jgi:hypothetical protein